MNDYEATQLAIELYSGRDLDYLGDILFMETKKLKEAEHNNLPEEVMARQKNIQLLQIATRIAQAPNN